MSESDKPQQDFRALVTGASSGIGLAFARELARRGKSLVLVARTEPLLKELKRELSELYQVSVDCIVTDLSTEEGLGILIEQSQRYSIDLLINNAGREDSGPFLSLDAKTMQDSIALNCTAPLALAHHFASRMQLLGGGQILFMSSIVSFQGVPLIANYAATKAYLLVLAEGLAAELKHLNIGVSVVAPGFTRSNLSPDISFKGTPLSPMDAEYVAGFSLKKMASKRLIIPGAINKFLFYSGKYLQPRKVNTFSFGLVFKRVLREKLNKLDSKASGTHCKN